MKLNKAVANRLKEILKEKDISQYELSKISGVPQSTISTIKNAETKSVNVLTLYYICASLNIEIKEFFDSEYLQLNNIDD